MNFRAKRKFPCRLSEMFTLIVTLVAFEAGRTEAQESTVNETGMAHLGRHSIQGQLSDKELEILETHCSPVITAKFTSDGKWIVVSGSDGVTIHDGFSSKCIHWLNGELIELSPDGQTFLLDHPNGSPELRSIPDGDLIWRLPTDIVTRQMHFSDDGQYVVCGYRNLLRIETKEVVYRSPKTYHYDWMNGGDNYKNPVDSLPQGDGKVASPQGLSILPHIYRKTLRSDGRPLISLNSKQCSPGGRFMFVQTGEEDDSYAPLYSLIHRKTGERLFSNVFSPNVLFFHDDDFILHEGKVYQTKDKKIRYSLAEGITSWALNSEETMLAVGWRNGEVAVLDPFSGEEIFRKTIEEFHDSQKQKSGHIRSLAFSNDSELLAAVGRKLTLIDISSQTISGVLPLGRGSREVGRPETTSPADIVFNADDSRLLHTTRQGDEYTYSRAKSQIIHASDLKKRQALTSPDFFDRAQKLKSIYFNSDGAWAIVPKNGRGSSDRLKLWNTKTKQPIVDIPSQAFDWHYRRRFIVPDFPKRHLGLGRFRSWYRDEITMDPWSVESIELANELKIPNDAQKWLEGFVHMNPHYVHRNINGRALDFPARQWRLSFIYNRIQRLCDLSTGEIYPPDSSVTENNYRRIFDPLNLPQHCWGLAGAKAAAFLQDGSHLFVYCERYKPKSEHFLVLFGMPSGKLVHHYRWHAPIGEIRIAPNNRIAAVSTDFYRKTWIIDIGSGKTIAELPNGGKCVFSPDSRYAQVGDRYGKSRSLLAIETGELLDFTWADYWDFSPNSRYAIGGSGRSWFFLDLETSKKLEIPGETYRTGRSSLSTTKLELPYQGSRVFCVDQREVRLFDMNTAKSLAMFDPTKMANKRAKGHDKTPDTFAPTSAHHFLYAPNDQNFIYVIEGSGAKGDSANDKSQGPLEDELKEYSAQVLVGDLESGQQIECSAPSWAQSILQHRVFTPDGKHFLTISSDKMACWKLHPLKLTWETKLSNRWTDPETGIPFAQEDTLGWNIGYAIHPSDKSILIAADGREAILFDLVTGKEQQRFGPLPINAVLRFGKDGAYLQAAFRTNQSMRLYDVSSGDLVKTYHFTNQGTKLDRFDAAYNQ